MPEQDPDVPTDADRLHALQRDYLDLVHGVQSACEYGLGGMHGAPGTPNQDLWDRQKHLRVGVNMALRQQEALFGLLRDKGLITQLEYVESLVNHLRDFIADLEAEYQARFPGGPTIKFR